VEPLPTVAPSCSLSDLELREQLARYRVVGDGAEMLEWTDRRRAIRVAGSVPEPLLERVVDVERQCCPFFELSWDRASRCLTISVSAVDQEPALDALTYALGLAGPKRRR
jgi:hypothetical protein